MEKFDYKGVTFTPEGNFRNDEKMETVLKETKVSGLTPKNWSYHKFYDAAKKAGLDKNDKYSVNGVLVIPTEYGLREY